MAEVSAQAQFTGTREVQARDRFDEARLAAWMDGHVEGFAGPLSVRQFKGGQSNPTYELTTPGCVYVLRRKPFGKLLPSAHAVDREYRLIAALHPTGFPVARPLRPVFGRGRDRGDVLRDGTGGRPHPLEPRPARRDARGAGRDLRRAGRDARAPARAGSRRGGPRRLWAARQLLRPAGGPLVQAVPAPPRANRSRKWTG